MFVSYQQSHIRSVLVGMVRSNGNTTVPVVRVEVVNLRSRANVTSALQLSKNKKLRSSDLQSERHNEGIMSKREEIVSAGLVNDEGDTIRVVRGIEKFSPRQYQTIDIGPFELTTTVKPGETREEAFMRASEFLAKMARAEYVARSKEFIERVKDFCSR